MSTHDLRLIHPATVILYGSRTILTRLQQFFQGRSGREGDTNLRGREVGAEKKLGLRLIGAYRPQSALSALFCNSRNTTHLNPFPSCLDTHFVFAPLFFTMHLWQATLPFCLLASAALPAAAASAWGFADATVAVQPKGAGIKGGFKEQ